MTFSIVGRCPRTGDFGVAISSSSPAVAARCAHVRAGIGAVCSQNITDPRLGTAALDLLAMGVSAEAAIEVLKGSRAHIEMRQLTAIDGMERGAVFSGKGVLGRFGEAVGTDCVAAGNLLADEGVPRAMVGAFEGMEGELGARLMAALRAGLAAGGEAGPVFSAGLVVVEGAAWPVTDLRVDWDEDPVGRLETLWEIWAPQKEAYVTRALRPGEAPGFGVAGEG